MPIVFALFVFALFTAACSGGSDGEADGTEDAGVDVAHDGQMDSPDDADVADDVDAGDSSDDVDAGDGSDDVDAGDGGDDVDAGEDADSAAPKAAGEACTDDDQCGSGHCVDEVCCDVACDGTCEACNVEGQLGTCTAIPDGEDPDDECEDEGASSCGYSGVCDGARACAKYTEGTICRAAEGACDVAEKCPGAGAACPADDFVPSGIVCRPAAGSCDLAETCTGTSAFCPDDQFVPSTTICRVSAGPCDIAEACTGTSASCPANAFEPSTTVCRPYADVCDVAETCTGTSAECPPDGIRGWGRDDPGVCAYSLNHKQCDGKGIGPSHCRETDGTPGSLCANPTNCNSSSCVDGLCE